VSSSPEAEYCASQRRQLGGGRGDATANARPKRPRAVSPAINGMHDRGRLASSQSTGTDEERAHQCSTAEPVTWPRVQFEVGMHVRACPPKRREARFSRTLVVAAAAAIDQSTPNNVSPKF